MVWSTLGPPNELFEEAMADIETLGGWIGSATLRENLAPDSLGMAMFEAADAGAITDDDALLLVQTIVAALCRHHGHDPVVRPSARSASSPTSGRCCGPSPVWCATPSTRACGGTRRPGWQGASRPPKCSSTTSRFPPASDAGCCSPRPIGIRADGTSPTGSMCGAAWPDTGLGLRCASVVGRQLAQLEADALLSELIRRVERWEPAGEPEPWMTAIGHGPASLPVTLLGGRGSLAWLVPGARACSSR